MCVLEETTTNQFQPSELTSDNNKTIFFNLFFRLVTQNSFTRT